MEAWEAPGEWRQVSGEGKKRRTISEDILHKEVELDGLNGVHPDRLVGGGRERRSGERGKGRRERDRCGRGQRSRGRYPTRPKRTRGKQWWRVIRRGRGRSGRGCCPWRRSGGGGKADWRAQAASATTASGRKYVLRRWQRVHKALNRVSWHGRQLPSERAAFLREIFHLHIGGFIPPMVEKVMQARRCYGCAKVAHVWTCGCEVRHEVMRITNDGNQHTFVPFQPHDALEQLPLLAVLWQLVDRYLAAGIHEQTQKIFPFVLVIETVVRFGECQELGLVLHVVKHAMRRHEVPRRWHHRRQTDGSTNQGVEKSLPPTSRSSRYAFAVQCPHHPDLRNYTYTYRGMWW